MRFFFLFFLSSAVLQIFKKDQEFYPELRGCIIFCHLYTKAWCNTRQAELSAHTPLPSCRLKSHRIDWDTSNVNFAAGHRDVRVLPERLYFQFIGSSFNKKWKKRVVWVRAHTNTHIHTHKPTLPSCISISWIRRKHPGDQDESSDIHPILQERKYFEFHWKLY